MADFRQDAITYYVMTFSF